MAEIRAQERAQSRLLLFDHWEGDRILKQGSGPTARLLLLVGFAIPFLVSAVVFFAVFKSIPESETAQRWAFKLEIVKSLLQLVVVVIVGGVVTLSFRLLEARRQDERRIEEERRERYQLSSETRMDYLKRVGGAYRTAKAVRRRLQSAQISVKFTDVGFLSRGQIGIYKAEMRKLNDAQLQLEELKIEAEYHPVFQMAKDLPRMLRSMESYLRKVLSEFEANIFFLEKDNKHASFKNLKRLREFTDEVDPKNSKGFEQRFATEHDRIIALVSGSL